MRSGQRHLAPGKQVEGPQTWKPIGPLSSGLLKHCAISPQRVTPEPRASHCLTRLIMGPDPAGSRQDHSPVKQCFSSFPMHSSHGVEVVKQIPIPDSVGLDWDLRCCISDKLPAAAHPASLGPQFDHKICKGPLTIKEESQFHQDI